MKTAKNSNNKLMGDKFEAYIGTIYQSLGYRVTYNVQLSGQQVDILAEKIIAGAGASKIAVECKYQSDGRISNQKVFDFIAVAETLIRADGITKAVMVTNAAYTDKAWAAARKNQFIELMTQRYLEDHLFDLSSTYRSFIETYESHEIFSEYVTISGTCNGYLPQSKVKNVEAMLTEWLEEPSNRFMTVFGDFGAGKTTLLNRLKYTYAKAYIEGRTTLKPFVIYLKDFHKHDTIDKLLTYSAAREFERDISLKLIYRQIQSGELILLLDGFDEMAQQIDTNVRMYNFLLLAPLLGQRAVITCRPSYFVSQEEYLGYADQLSQRSALRQPIEDGSFTRQNLEERVLLHELSVYMSREFITPHSLKPNDSIEYEVLEIESLSPVAIDDFLQKHEQAFQKDLGVGWREIKHYLGQIYDISDLMTRPMLLKMIVKTLLSGMLDINSQKEKIGPANLYELYTSLYLQLDFEKGDSRQLFTADQRRTLATSIALIMYEQRSPEVSYNQLLKFIAEHPDLQKILGTVVARLTFEQIVSDIQICTFLVSSESGQFRFAHKSFMEFFTAKHLKQRMIGRKIPGEFFEMLPKELLYFLGSYATLDDSVKNRLHGWLKKNNSEKIDTTLGRNLAAAVLYSGSVIEELNWQNICVSYIEFKRRTLKNVRFEQVNLLQLDLINARIIKNIWSSVHMSQVKLHDCEIHDSTITAIVQHVTVDLLLVENSAVSFSGKNLNWKGGSVRHSALSVSGSGAISNCIFTSSNLDWDNQFSGNITFRSCEFSYGSITWPEPGTLQNCRFLNCTFSDQEISFVYNGTAANIFDNCTFFSCEFASMLLDPYLIKNSTFSNCCGYAVLDDLVDAKVIKDFRQPGEVEYYKNGDMYYIPEKLWKKCKQDLLTFLEIINS